MVSPEERISRVEDVIEQIIERQGNLERMLHDSTTTLVQMLDKKADKTELRLMFAVIVTLMIALFSAVLGPLGAIITKI